jgi:hypothetical protein
MNTLKKARRLLLSVTMLSIAGISPLAHADDILASFDAGSLSVTPDRGLDFGDVKVGESSTEGIVITNSGSAPLRITALTLHGAGLGFVVAPGLPIDLAPGGEVRLGVRFAPATMERIAGMLEIGCDASAGLEYAIAGRGVFPVLLVGRTSIDFGRVGFGQSRIDSFMIRNGGTAELRDVVVEIPMELSSLFEIISSPAAFDLEPGERRQIVVRLREQRIAGEISATAMIHASDGLRGSIDLSATIVERTSRVAPDFITSGGIVFALSPVVPNPASEQATVSVSSGGSRDIDALLMVIDTRGEIVSTPFDGTIHAGATEIIRIDPRPLPTGIYRVVLRAAGRIVSTELVVGR